MLRKSSYVALWIFAILGVANIILGYRADDPDQFDYGLVWLGIATVAALVYRFSKRS